MDLTKLTNEELYKLKSGLLEQALTLNSNLQALNNEIAKRESAPKEAIKEEPKEEVQG